MSKPTLSHVFLFCFDLEKMIDFYTHVMGFHLSDKGVARGREIAFLTLNPDADHHQLALAPGRVGPTESGPLNHIAFRVSGMDELRRRHAILSKASNTPVETTSHGSWLSVYKRDPEQNKIEFFVDTPWYIRQPTVEPLDLTQSDEQIFESIRRRFGGSEGFTSMAEWKKAATGKPALV